jgi:hypothetical protein
MGCLFCIFSSPQPENPNIWNTAEFSNVAPVQLYSRIYIVQTKGLNINETNGSKVVIDPIAISAIGEVRGGIPVLKKVCYFPQLQMSASLAIFSSLCLKVTSLDKETCLASPSRVEYNYNNNDTTSSTHK